MTPTSSVAMDAARRLWGRATGDSIAPEEATAIAERVHSQLRAGLVNWIGAEGYRALLDRALALVEPEHPAPGRNFKRLLVKSSVRVAPSRWRPAWWRWWPR